MSELLDLYGRTSKQVRAAADLALRRHGLRLGQDLLLAQLWRQDGRTPGELASAIGVSTPAITKTATLLTGAGLLVRRPHERDNRLVRLWLTDAGRGLQPQVERERQALEAALTRRLSPTQVASLTRALTELGRAATEIAASADDDARGST